MINNAGLGGTSSVLDMTDEQWQRVLDVTLNGTFRCTRAALRQMVAQGHGGAVVNNASVLGWRAQPGQAHYAAAKAGVMAFTRCAALDVAGHGIRVNAVAPSLAIHPFLAKVTSEDLLADLAAREAFGRAAEPRRGRQRHGLPGQRLRLLPHRGGHLGKQPAGVTVRLHRRSMMVAVAMRAAGAHGDQRRARAAPLEFVQGGGEQPGAGAAHRVAEGDRAAVDVDPVWVGVVHAPARTAPPRRTPR